MIGQRLGPYEVVAKLGAGGMGEVYRARDARLGRDVAVKIVLERTSADPERQRRLMQEARAAGTLNHPNILTVYDVGLDGERPYIVSELVDGRPLRDELGAGRLSVTRLIDLAAQIADGLAAAHDAGILHRDLKPDNVLVNRSGRVKIIDFGLAKPVVTSGTARGGQATETEPGLILGTVPYMSPEQARGAPADFRSDQFSFGLILYEMATGKAPFRRETPVQTLSAIISEDPEPVASLNPKVPAPLRWVIDRCLAKDPRQRYAATADLFHDLRTIREHLAEATAAKDAPIPPLHRRWRRAGGVGLTLLVGALGGYLLWSSQQRRIPPPTYTTLSFGQGLVSEARFVGDGQSVIYGAAWVGGTSALYQMSPGRPETRMLQLPPNSGLFAISKSGEIAIASNCSLNWGRCMGTLAIGSATIGVPRSILDDVHEADFLPDDDKKLVVAQFVDGADRIFLHPEMKEIYTAPGWITHLKVSPRGDRIAFLDHPTIGHMDGSVAVIDFKGNRTQLTGLWAGLQGLAWHPSGEEIWFTGSESHLQNSGIHAVSLSKRLREVEPARGDIPVIGDISRDGQRVLLWRQFARGEVMGLAAGETMERNLTVFDFSAAADLSADGKRLLLYDRGTATQGRPTVYLRPTDGTPGVLVGEGKPLALSPDGKWAVALQQATRQLVLLPIGPGEQRALPRGPIREYFDWAAWNPDSTRVYFAAAEEGRRGRTYVQDIQSGLPQPVTPERYVGTSLSPDGRHLTVASINGAFYTCPVTGCEDPEPLPGYEEGDRVLQWTPDNRFLFLRAASDMTLNIFKLEIATGRRTLWKEVTPPHPVGLISIAGDPGEVCITPDGQSYAYTYWLAPSRLYLVQNLR